MKTFAFFCPGSESFWFEIARGQKTVSATAVIIKAFRRFGTPGFVKFCLIACWHLTKCQLYVCGDTVHNSRMVIENVLNRHNGSISNLMTVTFNFLSNTRFLTHVAARDETTGIQNASIIHLHKGIASAPTTAAPHQRQHTCQNLAKLTHTTPWPCREPV